MRLGQFVMAFEQSLVVETVYKSMSVTILVVLLVY